MNAINTARLVSTEAAITDTLRETCTLVQLHTRQWRGVAKDKLAANEVARSHNATGAGLRVYKDLLAGADEKLKAIHSLQAAAWRAHYAMTVPWSSAAGGDEDEGAARRRGPRLLSNAQFAEYISTMEDYRGQARAAVDEFCEAYPALRDKAREALGRLYDPSLYPTSDQIRARFAMTVEFSPVPDVGAFSQAGVKLPPGTGDMLDELMAERHKQMLGNAMKDIWMRTALAVKRMAERASSDGKLHASINTQVAEAVSLLRAFNIHDDPVQADMADAIEELLRMAPVEAMREDKALRHTAAVKADDIYARIMEAL